MADGLVANRASCLGCNWMRRTRIAGQAATDRQHDSIKDVPARYVPRPEAPAELLTGCKHIELLRAADRRRTQIRRWTKQKDWACRQRPRKGNCSPLLWSSCSRWQSAYL